jgi:hypothetical protein
MALLIGHNPRTILVALSPRMLLEIHLCQPMTDSIGIHHHDGVPPSKYREFRRRCIDRTSKEIIFNDRAVLEQWRRTAEYRRRVMEIRTTGRPKRGR